MELLIIFGIVLFVVYAFVKGKKVPKIGQKFTCQGCGTTLKHSKRTVNAIRNGSSSAFCGNCHSKWARNRPRGGSGCLGSLIALMLIPMFPFLYVVSEYVV